MSRFALAVIAILLLLTACSSSDGSEPGADGGDGTTAAPSTSTTKPGPTGPTCADTWKAGETLPVDYSRCTSEAAYGEQDVTKCQDGTSLVVYRDAFYAVTGGTIVKPDVAPLQDTEEFGAVYAACTGEE